jgi:nucleoside-diphosphate-sugar epimerase
VNPIGFRSCHGAGKRCAETLFLDYHRQHQLRIKVARIFNTWGPCMHPNDERLVSNLIMQSMQGKPITLDGDGSQIRSLCYVDDPVQRQPDNSLARDKLGWESMVEVEEGLGGAIPYLRALATVGSWF